MRLDDVYGYIGMNSELGKRTFTQKGIADHFKGSLGVVHYALRPLQRIGAIRKKTRGFELMDWRKFLAHWASMRKTDLAYSTRSSLPLAEIEASMPPALFTACSGARIHYDIAPSDYSECHVYGNPEAIEKRFPRSKGAANIFCSTPPAFLRGSARTPLTLIYVDLWNLGTWYAREFLNAVEVKLCDILE